MSLPVIDDLSRPFPQASSGGSGELLSDRVMGGVSSGTLRREVVRGRAALRLEGDVSLENNGGFIQMALDLDPGHLPSLGAMRVIQVDSGDWLASGNPILFAAPALGPALAALMKA